MICIRCSLFEHHDLDEYKPEAQAREFCVNRGSLACASGLYCGVFTSMWRSPISRFRSF